MSSRRTSSVPKEDVVFPWMLYCDSRCSQTPTGLSQALPRTLLCNTTRRLADRQCIILRQRVRGSVRAIRAVRNTRVFQTETRVVADARAMGSVYFSVRGYEVPSEPSEPTGTPGCFWRQLGLLLIDSILIFSSPCLQCWSIHISMCWLNDWADWKSCAEWNGCHGFHCSEYLQCLLYNPVALPYAFPPTLFTPTICL